MAEDSMNSVTGSRKSPAGPEGDSLSSGDSNDEVFEPEGEGNIDTDHSVCTAVAPDCSKAVDSPAEACSASTSSDRNCRSLQTDGESRRIVLIESLSSSSESCSLEGSDVSTVSSDEGKESSSRTRGFGSSRCISTDEPAFQVGPKPRTSRQTSCDGSNSDSDRSGIRRVMIGERKRSYRQRDDGNSSSEGNDEAFEAQRQLKKSLQDYSEISSSEGNSLEGSGVSNDGGKELDSRIRGFGSSRCSGTDDPAIQIGPKPRMSPQTSCDSSNSDSHRSWIRRVMIGERKRSYRQRDDGNSSSEGNDEAFEPERQLKKSCDDYSEISSSEGNSLEGSGVSNDDGNRSNSGPEGSSSGRSHGTDEPAIQVGPKPRMSRQTSCDGSNSDSDRSEIRPVMIGKRKRSYRQRDDGNSSSEGNDKAFEPERQLKKSRDDYSEISSCEGNSLEGSGVSNDGANGSNSGTGGSSSSRSHGTDEPAFQVGPKPRMSRQSSCEESNSDSDRPESRPVVNGRRRGSAASSGSNSNDLPSEPAWMDRWLRHSASESCSREGAHTGHTGVRLTVGTDGVGYECDGGQEVAGHTAVECALGEANGVTCANVPRTETGSQEVSTACQSGALSAPKDGGSEAAPSPSASSNVAADMSDGKSDKILSQVPTCPICLQEFLTQDVGTTDICNHRFCVVCLMEWSRHSNTCPVDRKRFSFIRVQGNIEGEIRRIRVLSPAWLSEDLLFERYCAACYRRDGQDRMLLCDRCYDSYHMECLDTPLDRMPVGVWFCAFCSLSNSILGVSD